MKTFFSVHNNEPLSDNVYTFVGSEKLEKNDSFYVKN